MSLASWGLLASGCELAPRMGCTLIGCEDQASISLRGLEAGHSYQVTVESADETVHCSIDTSDGLSMSCDGALHYSDRLDEANIELLGTPDSIAIEVLQDGTMIAQDLLMPTYEEVMPNGPGCEPTCLQAQIPFDV